MATAAQIEANSRNSKKSTGPRTEEGKNRSRLRALDHGCRANIMVLPAEVFGDYEKEVQAWRLSFNPRNPSEEFLIEGIVSVRSQNLPMRGYDALAPTDAAAARRMLLDIVDRVTDELEDKAGVYRELAEINLQTAGHRLSCEDTPEGERLRRYELTCKRHWFRMFDLLPKIRKTGAELDIATIASLGRSVPTVTMGEIDQPAPTVADVTSPPAEAIRQPDPPNKANLAQQNAPNEANLHVQAPSQEGRAGHKEHRNDTPHLDRKPGGIGTAGKTKNHPVLDRVLGGRNSNLMNLAPIFAGS